MTTNISKSKKTSLIVQFAGVQPSDDLNYSLYKKNSNDFLLHAQPNSHISYQGTNESDSDVYCVALYDDSNNSLTVTQTHLLNIRPISIDDKSITNNNNNNKNNNNDNDSNTNSKKRKSYAQQRSDLGEAFGTKKAKKAISDASRNAIDSSSLEESMQTAVIQNVKQSTINVPTTDSLKVNMEADRLIPPCNVSATYLEDIYPINDIIPTQEWNTINAKWILKESGVDARLETLPLKAPSLYIRNHLEKLQIQQDAQSTQSGGNNNFVEDVDHEKIKLLYYISLLIGFYLSRRNPNKKVLLQKLNHPPEILIDGLLKRYTVSKSLTNSSSNTSSNSSSKNKVFYIIDPRNEDRILCALFALCLHLDSFLVETPVLAQDLSLKPSRVVELFKALGCHVKSCTVAQREALGLNAAEAANYKLAQLSLPFKLPEVARRRRR